MMVSEIHLQCSRVITPHEGIRQDFPLGGNIYKFYNPFERLTVCSSERLNDLITVSSTWELTPVGTRYS